MLNTRREFLRHTSFAAAALATTGSGKLLASAPTRPTPSADASLKELCLVALDAATSAGASYADVRIVRIKTEFTGTLGSDVTSASSDETFGVGVRALVGGSWGFAAGSEVVRRECQRVAVQAAENARAKRDRAGRAVTLAPVSGYPDGSWVSAIDIDPFSVPQEDKAELLLESNRAALAVRGARHVRSSLEFSRQQTTFGSTEGSIIEQTSYRTAPSLVVTAVSADSSDFQSRASWEVAPVALGFEYVERANLVSRAEVWAEEAVQKLSARRVEPGRYDLILDPTNLFLTVHETIGRPTELDRVLDQPPYAGTSFLTPPAAMLGQLKYGPEYMNVLADRTQQGALATVGWDDEGVPADSWLLIKDGILVDYQTTRENANSVSELTGVTRSHGCAAAASWDRVQLPRMPNVSLLPGEDDHILDDLIAATDRGILVRGSGPFSVDRRRSSFQFGGELFYEVNGGQVGAMLRDAAYRGRTVDFWNTMDMLGGPRSYFLGGRLGDVKGQPSQAAAVSHGCPCARFRQAAVINADS